MQRMAEPVSPAWNNGYAKGEKESPGAGEEKGE
jgi:hypothetical protein